MSIQLDIEIIMVVVEAEWGSEGNKLNSYRYAVQTIEKINSINPDEDDLIKIDLSKVSWVTAAYSTPLATAIRRWRSEGVEIRTISPSDDDTANYLDTIGFPEGQTDPDFNDNSYLPLIKIDGTQACPINAAGEVIQRLVSKLLSDDDIRTNGVALPLTELLDNVSEHSKCEHGLVTLQYYKQKQKLDMCVVDDGISIPGSYDEHKIKYDDDADAVCKALEEGKSTKREFGSESRKRGTGLRTVSNIVCDGLDGKLLVVSGKGGVYKQDKITEICDLIWRGTTIFASMNVPKNDFNFTSYIPGSS